jgi:hypothetical protein
VTRPQVTITAAALLASAVAVWMVIGSSHEESTARTIGLILVVSWSWAQGSLR